MIDDYMILESHFHLTFIIALPVSAFLDFVFHHLLGRTRMFDVTFVERSFFSDTVVIKKIFDRLSFVLHHFNV